jgi:hypothetical protein
VLVGGQRASRVIDGIVPNGKIRFVTPPVDVDWDDHHQDLGLQGAAPRRGGRWPCPAAGAAARMASRIVTWDSVSRSSWHRLVTSGA